METNYKKKELRAYTTGLLENDKGRKQSRHCISILNSLLSSGKLDNIRNDSLKYLLADWNDLVDNYLEHQLIYRDDFAKTMREYEDERIPTFIIEADTAYNRNGKIPVSPLKFDRNKLKEQLINDLTYHNLIGRCINRLVIQLSAAQKILNCNNHIRILLKKEIGSKDNKG